MCGDVRWERRRRCELWPPSHLIVLVKMSTWFYRGVFSLSHDRPNPIIHCVIPKVSIRSDDKNLISRFIV